ncbi:hypothetical protein BJX76DRAFT_205179 [Aspergillus varians]
MCLLTVCWQGMQVRGAIAKNLKVYIYTQQRQRPEGTESRRKVERTNERTNERRFFMRVGKALAWVRLQLRKRANICKE